VLDAWIASKDQHGGRVRRDRFPQDESLGTQRRDTHRACYFAGRDIGSNASASAAFDAALT